MNLAAITPLLITFNEEDNISRTLAKLEWANRIVIVDSGSSDRTLEILAQEPRVKVFERPFVSFAEQCNFGLAQIVTPWALSLDADYLLSNGFADEIEATPEDATVNGYRASFIYCIDGRPLRGTLYPARIVFYRTAKAHYVQDGHGHRIVLDGDVGALRNKILHDDRKPLARWFSSQQRYAADEAHHLVLADPRTLSRVDRIRRMAWPAPILVFFYTLIVKRCVLDGWPGWIYVLQRTCAEIMIALEVTEQSKESR